MSMNEDFLTLLRNYLEKRGRSAISILARKAGLSRSTIGRAASGEQNPSETTIRAVIPHICSEDELASFTKKYLTDPISKVVYNNGTKAYQLENFLEGDQLDLEILAMTINDLGSTGEDIVEKSIFSENKVLNRIQQHLDSGLLEERDGRFFAKQEYTPNPATLAMATEKVAKMMQERLDRDKVIGLDLEALTDPEYMELLEESNELYMRYKKRIEGRPRTKDAKPRFFSIMLGTV